MPGSPTMRQNCGLGRARRRRRTRRVGRPAPPRDRRRACRVDPRCAGRCDCGRAGAARRATGSRLPLSASGSSSLVVDGSSAELVRELADGDAAGRRRGLQPRRRVDGVAGEEALAGAGRHVEAHECLAGVDADAHLQGRAVRAASCRSSGLDAAADRRAPRARRRPRGPAGTPKTPTTASPMNFSTTPPWASITLRAAA